MTAFVTSNIPSNINTLEKLHAWSGLALSRINPTLATLEQPGVTGERVAQATIFRAADNTVKLVVRCSFGLNEDYDTATTKVWESIQVLSATTIPTAYTTN